MGEWGNLIAVEGRLSCKIKQDIFNIVYQSSDTTVTDYKVHASPGESVSYQWMKDGQPLSESSDFSDTCAEILLINEASLGAEGI